MTILDSVLDKTGEAAERMERTERTERISAEGKGVRRVAVAGVSGYAGGELARLLLRHPRMEGAPLLFLGREESGGGGGRKTTLGDLHPQLGVDAAAVEPFGWDLLRERGIEVLLLATPHEQSREWVPMALAAGMRVIDLSGAWRLHEASNHAVYGLTDRDAEIAERTLAEAVYGLPELHREAIRTARLVANPGCYATSVILALAPLVRSGMVDLERGIVCDAKSGVSGAGKAATAGTHFMYAADNLSAYAVFGHRHTGELLEQLHLTGEQIRFTPHLLPIPRGILSTVYLRLKQTASAEAVTEAMREFYLESPMVRVRAAGRLPQIQHVVRTNFCDVGLEVGANGRDVVVVACLDNLLKGAAGQAVENLNLMCGWDEAEGLR